MNFPNEVTSTFSSYFFSASSSICIHPSIRLSTCPVRWLSSLSSTTDFGLGFYFQTYQFQLSILQSLCWFFKIHSFIHCVSWAQSKPDWPMPVDMPPERLAVHLRSLVLLIRLLHTAQTREPSFLKTGTKPVQQLSKGACQRNQIKLTNSYWATKSQELQNWIKSSGACIPIFKKREEAVLCYFQV